MPAVTVNSVVLKKCLATAVKAGLVAMISGSPGIGKSAVVRETADDYMLKMVDVRLAQCDPTDLNGPLYIFEEKGKAGYVPMETFPLEGDPLPINEATGKPYQGWLIFFDEINSAAKAVQAASYKVVLDRMIGQRNLHPNVVIMAAGNLETDNAIVEELSSALQSRMIHFILASDYEAWLDIAAKAQVVPEITSFIRYKPTNLNNFAPDKQGDEKTYACERTWFFANDLLTKGKLDINDRETALPLLAGTLGQGVAREFLAHARIFTNDLPSIQDIVNDPQTANVPTAPGHIYGMCGMMAAHAKPTIMAPLMEYMARYPMEYQALSLREMTRRDFTLIQHPTVSAWTIKNGQHFS